MMHCSNCHKVTTVRQNFKYLKLKMPTCCVKNCCNSAAKGFRLFRFPIRERERRNLWLRNSGLEHIISKFENTEQLKWEDFNLKICEGHFTSDQYEMAYKNGYHQLKKNAVPTIFSQNPSRILDPDLKRPLSSNFSNIQQNLNAEKSQENELNLLVIPKVTQVPVNTKNCNQNELEKLRQQVKDLLKENKKLRDEIADLKKKSLKANENLKKIFSDNQVDLIERNPKTNSKQWDANDIRKGLIWRCKMNVRPYEYIRTNEQYGLIPLPSNRTLNRHIEHLTFVPGVCTEIIQWLGSKIHADEDSSAAFCVLSLDEMSLRPRVEFDKALGMYLGLVSPEISRNEAESELQADHVLAVIARGLTSHWKQTVSYVFTGKSTERHKLWEYILSVIRALHSVKLHVVAITSDMGPSNVALWAMNGIHAVKAQVTASCPHPIDENNVLYWTPDVPHILKNIWCQLLRTDFILPSFIVLEHNLPSAVVSIKHVQQLLEAQEQAGGAKIVPKLQPVHIDPSQFEKMRVGLATDFFSEQLGRGLQFAAQSVSEIDKEAATTGWFILQVSEWYKIMMARHKSEALSNSDKHKSKIEFLKKYIVWFKELQFAHRNSWKPIQTGTLLATTTVLRLCDTFLDQNNIEYILTSRLSTSCVENLFSQVRGGGNIYPGPVRLRQMLRILSVAQFMAVPTSASYPDDEEGCYIDFLNEKRAKPFKNDEVDEFRLIPDHELSVIQANGLYFMAGWAVSKIQTACEQCTNSLKSPRPVEELPCRFTMTIDRGKLTHPTTSAYEVAEIVEGVFLRQKTDIIKMGNVKNVLLQGVLRLLPLEIRKKFPECHTILQDFVCKLLSLRLHILSSDISKENQTTTVLDSKSSFMQTVSEVAKKRKKP